MLPAIRLFAAATILGCLLPMTAYAEPQSATLASAPTEPDSPVASATSVAAPMAAAKPTPPAKPAVTLQAKVDLAQQTITVVERGRTVATWKVSSGVEDHATPRGIFQPEWTAKMWYSHTYDGAPMPHAVFFKDGAAIHATQAIGALGRAASHGCVRLAPANAETFYKLVQRHGLAHTRISVFGTPPPSRQLLARRENKLPQRLANAEYRYSNQGTVWSPLWAKPYQPTGYASNSVFAPTYTRPIAYVRVR